MSRLGRIFLLLLLPTAVVLLTGCARHAVKPPEPTVVPPKMTIQPSQPPSTAAGLNVRQDGPKYIVDAPGRFAFAVVSSQADQNGWSVSETCGLRVRFTSVASPGTMTIYADGRMYWGGEFRPLNRALHNAAELSQQHASPAEIVVPESMGRVNRSTTGDLNNDGYNETRGAYQLTATSSRLEFTITPKTPLLVNPVLEITGLPPGNALITIEGRLVEGSVRLADGTLLVELPARFQRPTLINVRIP